ncbi:hypothetical protein [Pseudomonas rhizosphaerae]
MRSEGRVMKADDKWFTAEK